MSFQIAIFSKEKEEPYICVASQDKLETAIQDIAKGALIWNSMKSEACWINPTNINFIKITKIQTEPLNLITQTEKEVDKMIEDVDQIIENTKNMIDQASIDHQKHLCEE